MKPGIVRDAILRPLARALACLTGPRMLYGQRSGDGAWREHSRISTATRIEGRKHLRLGDHVFIGHFNLIDATGGVTIDEGVQITNFVSVLTHSSHRALRLERERYWGNAAPAGMERGAVAIGAWSFIGPHVVIAPGARLGRGVLVRAFSFVAAGDVPDFAVLEGQPARVVGDTREADCAWIERHGDAVGPERAAAYEAWARGVSR